MAREIDKTLQDLVALQALDSGAGLTDEGSGSGSGLDLVAGSAGGSALQRAVSADPEEGASGAQLREWKHQLAREAEVLRRDGAKVVLREKRALEEREKIREARAAIEQEYRELQILERHLEADKEAHDAREKKCQELQKECDHWRREVSQAQAALAQVTRPEAAGAEKSLQEQACQQEQRELIERLGGRVGELLAAMATKEREVTATEALVAQLQHELESRGAGGAEQQRALEAEVAQLRTRCVRLLKEKDAGERERATQTIKQAAPIDDTKARQEREELARERQELEAKAQQLEQVQRTLEREELDWGRRLSDHSAIKTVTMAGVFILLATVVAFVGAYVWVRPVYRGEATVQVAIGAGGERALNTFLTRHAEAIRDNHAVVEGAWTAMRQHGYADDDTREAWAASLAGKDGAAGRLTLQGDQAGRMLTLRYSGPTAAGVATACNALAESLASVQSEGVGAIRVAAPSVAPLRPMEDRRFIVGLEGAGGLIAVGAGIAGAMAWRKRRRTAQ